MKALTVEELREMAGQPVWCPEEDAYGIVMCDKHGKWCVRAAEKRRCLIRSDHRQKRTRTAPGVARN